MRRTTRSLLIVGLAALVGFERLVSSKAYEVADTEDLKPGDKQATIAKTAKALGVKGVLVGRVSDRYELTLFASSRLKSAAACEIGLAEA